MRGVPAFNSLAYQSGQFGRILLQIQALRLAERPPQGVADNLAGVIVKPALDSLFDDRLKFSRKRYIHIAMVNRYPEITSFDILAPSGVSGLQFRPPPRDTPHQSNCSATPRQRQGDASLTFTP